MIRYILMFFFYMGETSAAPAWVEGLRSGEERFKLQNGDRTMFRRIARDCPRAYYLVEQDIKREYNSLVKYTVELVFEDEQGCAVTTSVGRAPELREMGPSDALYKISETAMLNAFIGMSHSNFVKLTKDGTSIITDKSPYSYCIRAFKTVYKTVHGLVEVCWDNQVVVGYCIPKSDGCWKKSM